MNHLIRHLEITLSGKQTITHNYPTKESLMSDTPIDLEKIIQDIVAHIELEKQREKENEESSLEYLYDYVEYPESIEIGYDEADNEDWSTVIKINL